LSLVITGGSNSPKGGAAVLRRLGYGTVVNEHPQHDDAPLVVVTTRVGGRRAGCLVGFHTQASMQPEVYAVWLSRANRTTALAIDADHLAVHYLTSDQLDVAEHWGSLTGDEVDKFATAEWDPGPYGLPLLRACPDRMVLKRVEVIDVPEADHLCWLGTVELARPHHGEALRLGDVEDLVPGHEADEVR
jgi:flavin reductase (DIM6/NTAB) family NADH-FMN oxidoreductase RutF